MIGLLVALACAAEPVQAPLPPPVEQPVTNSSSAVPNPAPELHPGEVQFLDPDGSTRVQKAAELPQGIAWVKLGELWEPVVRVEAIEVGGRVQSITKFGVDGRALERVTPPPPRPR